MSETYIEIPKNFEEIRFLFVMDIAQISKEIIISERILFYDTCSFRRHSNIERVSKEKLINYYKQHNSKIVITRIILMELASTSGVINQEYIEYLKEINNAGIKIILLNEENVFDVISECFSTNLRVNEYLSWAVRLSKSSVSTITKTLNEDSKLYDELVRGKNLNQSDIYQRFFSQVRKNKEHDDNLGEELIGICTYILSYLPGTKDGKICIISDDKGAAGKQNAMYRRTPAQLKGAKIILFSTPKLVQHMYQEGMELTEKEIVDIISQGTSGNIVVMGTTAYDIIIDDHIAMSGQDLARKIMEPNGINIVF